MKTLVDSGLIWMFRDQFVDVFLSLLIMLIKCGFLSSMKLCRCSVLDVEEWGMG
ncbi:hypothetical protein Golob_023913 [Gossypium lobatum]|uniref:Uncharacterized protein n=1 Tax=Gossypium lobatum TaxID=34289 RepID=A0A7J8NJ30_9ROSI|nr:hypothetical protein [Gossypium lobatum]